MTLINTIKSLFVRKATNSNVIITSNGCDGNPLFNPEQLPVDARAICPACDRRPANDSGICTECAEFYAAEEAAILEWEEFIADQDF